MITTEKEKLKSILDKLLTLGQSTLATNEEILQALKNCNSCKLSQINQLPKKQRYKLIDDVDEWKERPTVEEFQNTELLESKNSEIEKIDTKIDLKTEKKSSIENRFVGF